jgi:3D (Asp-Asp-Asp) domain-containing protein
MKYLVRGGAVLSILALCVVFIYANVPTEPTLAIANGSFNVSETVIDNNISEISDTEEVEIDDETAKKLVKTTGSVKATGMGASRGAFNATAYCLSGRTAMGHGVRRGIIAADPRVLKLGSRVTIDAGPWSGTYIVSDTGGGIKGKRIDIWVPSCGEARKFGRRSINVFSAL